MRSVFIVVCVAISAISAFASGAWAQSGPPPRFFPIAPGWARNQINTVVFRKNSLTSDGKYQYAAFYNEEGKVVLAKRRLGTARWDTRVTQYVGDVADAHKSISIAVDRSSFLHVVWNQHNSRLQYCRSRYPRSLELSAEMAMIGDKENSVTYPEFHNLPHGDLLFLYRDGSSGKGNLVINRYDAGKRKWLRVQDGLIDGEGSRSAYWQATVDQLGTIHLSWVWRETSDVWTNHDLCYAKSTDGGLTWTKSFGEKYQLPITALSAEYAIRIPEGSDLINQTSMSTDAYGQPYIATYWRTEGTTVPQLRLVYSDGRGWRMSQITHRREPFTLRGVGTRRIPLSRPQVVVNSKHVLVVFRDAERGNRITIASSEDLEQSRWSLTDLLEIDVGLWEPTYDPIVWDVRKELHLFVQKVGQGEAESLEKLRPQMVSVLEWRPQ